MEELKKHEQFEIEVLDTLNSSKLLEPLLFCGGTMLRLCHGLRRYSVDLDFWFIKSVDYKIYFQNIKNCLKGRYIIRDSKNKHFTFVIEISSDNYPRSLKVEIRKEIKDIAYDDSIAYSKFSNKQIFTKTLKLTDMMSSKIQTFLSRKEIRDCFDMEFLIQKGIKPDAPDKDLIKLLRYIEGLSRLDYKVKLGSILEEELRKYYIENNFKILKATIRSIIKI